jgi:hypothetical protein
VLLDNFLPPALDLLCVQPDPPLNRL